MLAIILVHAIKEFEGMDPKKVETLIEGDISIGNTPVDPGFTNEKDKDGRNRIVGINTEDKVPLEGVRYFDILFKVRTAEGLSRIIVNIEAQKDKPSAYRIERRGIFYAAREISAQLDREFSGEDYNSICKVYSIWICMNSKENALCHIRLALENKVGQCIWNEDDELLNVIIVRMKNQLDEDMTHKLHRFLGALFITRLSTVEKEAILKTEYKIDTKRYGKELYGGMCDLSRGILEEGRAEERKEIIRKMMNKGMTEEAIKDLLDATDEQIEEAKADFI